jgi:formamidopyrimidine-DNA glycosylase
VPELIEVELYRRAADAAVGRTIESVPTIDPLLVRQGIPTSAVVDALVGRAVTATRRHGKLLVLEFDPGASLGLRFGMTGRLVVDDVAPIPELLYSSGRDDPQWDRLVVRLSDGGTVRLNDPRRLGAVLLDPDESALGPDATAITTEQLALALRSDVALKARLLDQRRVAGIGNLIADETLWRARLRPSRPARSLDHDEVVHLRRTLRATIRVLTRRGGAHTGDLQPARLRGGTCPRCSAPLRRDVIGTRTTFWCPAEQR